MGVSGPTSANFKLDFAILCGRRKKFASFGGKEQESHSSEPTPPSGSEAEEATKLKIRLSPKVTLVVESPPHRHTSDPMDVEPTMTVETKVLTSTPQRPLPPAHLATLIRIVFVYT